MMYVLLTPATAADEDDGSPPTDSGATPVEVGEAVVVVQIA
jgi:hypothetical protein